MGMFSDLLRKMADFLADADQRTPAKKKSRTGIEALAAKRLRALQERLTLVEGQIDLAAQTRRELQRLVAEAKAVEAIG